MASCQLVRIDGKLIGGNDSNTKKKGNRVVVNGNQWNAFSVCLFVSLCVCLSISYYHHLNKIHSSREPSNIIYVSDQGRKEMFYLTTHSTHFIYGYMASGTW